MNLIDQTNQPTGTYYEVMETSNLKNIAFQYKIIAGEDEYIKVKIQGTVRYLRLFN